MEKAIICIAGILMIVVIIMGCDPNAAKREQAKKKWIMTPEQSQKQAQAYQSMMEELERYKNDFGVYPQTLEELQQAGYTIHPRSDGPNGGWDYRLVGDIPQLAPAYGQQ